MQARICTICLYPLKSALGYHSPEALVQPQGLHFDREFMLTELNGKFITARSDAELYHFSALPTSLGLHIQHKDGTQLIIRYQDFTRLQDCEIWETTFSSYVAIDEVNHWFSVKMGRKVQLRWTGEKSKRQIKRFPDKSVSFADGYPLLLTNTYSLQQLQIQCPSSIKMSQFRPNIVVEGKIPFEEQQWDKIQIGEVTFLHTKPCERCVLTTRDPDTNKLDLQMEPFRSLKKINSDENGKPVFGINLLPLNSGTIRVGNTINILSYRK